MIVEHSTASATLAEANTTYQDKTRDSDVNAAGWISSKVHLYSGKARIRLVWGRQHAQQIREKSFSPGEVPVTSAATDGFRGTPPP